jgi:hypothetical protein
MVLCIHAVHPIPRRSLRHSTSLISFR